MDNKNKYNFLVFSNSKWGEIPNRDQHLAYQLAQMGYNVIFINEIPSLASKMRSCFWKEIQNPFCDSIPSNLKIIEPPTIPTYFRSSLCKNVDKILIQQWLNTLFKSIEPKKYFAVISVPIWFYLIGKKLGQFYTVIYDLYDSLEISARNKRALNYLERSEKEGIELSRFITCSSPSLQEYIKKKYKRDSALIRNGSPVIGEINKLPYRNKTRIGLLANIIQDSVYDLSLIKSIALSSPECEVRIIGIIKRRYSKQLKSINNIVLTGFCSFGAINSELMSLSAAIIPFQSNSITAKINPLKLYEYLSRGIPVVATDNFDYSDANDLIYTAKTHQEFIIKLNLALMENDESLINQRIKWSVYNSWNCRTSEFLNFLNIGN